ncbi:hypothetical protein CDAR_289691 [Caerostris darwini]|uniref:Uncharacterized protein n=1 Tax=Caerostris darwini TaxID=1538125 RepID=A0AAV4WYR2_9ARAC|nr:hypothetical protein CDAR_289691 [Caerostris darwini]
MARNNIPLALLDSSLIQFDYLRRKWNAWEVSLHPLIVACHQHLGLETILKSKRALLPPPHPTPKSSIPNNGRMVSILFLNNDLSMGLKKEY